MMGLKVFKYEGYNALNYRNKLLYCVKLVLCFSLVGGAVFFVIKLPFPYYCIMQIILGALVVHMKELQHEALHGVFRTKVANRLLGMLLGAPMLVSYSDYQYHHMVHHKYTGTPDDTEYFTYSEEKSKSLTGFIYGLFMLDHYISIFKKMISILFQDKGKGIPKGIRKKIKVEYALILLCIAVLIGSSFFSGKFFFLVLKVWIVPVFFISGPINFFIELPEHVFCNKSDNIFTNTRTIKSNKFMTWFVNGNNYHVEHHYTPHYPIPFLPRLHREIKEEIVHYDHSYLQFYTNFFRRLKK